MGVKLFGVFYVERYMELKCKQKECILKPEGCGINYQERTFKDGTKHIEAICSNCNRHIGWSKKNRKSTHLSLKDRWDGLFDRMVKEKGSSFIESVINDIESLE